MFYLLTHPPLCNIQLIGLLQIQPKVRGLLKENSESNSRVCRDAAWLAVDLDQRANEANGPRISTAASRVAAWVIPTDEELMIARHTRHVLRKT